MTGRSEVPLIYTRGGSAVIRDVEVNMSGEEAGKGIAFDNYTAQRVWFHNGLDCAHQGRNVTITDSYCDLPKLSQGSSAHADGFQSDGGGNYVFRHNTIRNPNEQTSAILMSTNTSPISNVVIDHNLMSGGGYTVYCGTDEGGMTPNLTYTNNVISREFFPRGGYWGATTWCDRAARSGNNVLDGNYVPPPGTVLPGSSPPAAAPGARRGAGRLRKARAKRKARAALRRALGRDLVRSANGVHAKCKRRAHGRVACRVSWRQGKKGHAKRRFQGKVVMHRVSADRVHYRLRVHRWSRKCDCGRVIKRKGTV